MNDKKSSRYRENMNIETNLCFFWMNVLTKGGINREEYTKLNNILAESLGSGIELAEEDMTEDETHEGKL